MNVNKPSGYTIAIPKEMLDDALADGDMWNRTINPPSPLERARMEVEDAKARVEEAQEALAAAEDEYESQCVTPGSDIRPPPFTMTEALGRALARPVPMSPPSETAV